MSVFKSLSKLKLFTLAVVAVGLLSFLVTNSAFAIDFEGGGHCNYSQKTIYGFEPGSLSWVDFGTHTNSELNIERTVSGQIHVCNSANYGSVSNAKIRVTGYTMNGAAVSSSRVSLNPTELNMGTITRGNTASRNAIMTINAYQLAPANYIACVLFTGSSSTGSASGSMCGKIKIEATPPVAAPDCTLTANPTTITRGQSSTLKWTSHRGTFWGISPDIGTIGPNGERTVTPQSTITYTLLVVGPGGSITCPAQVVVKDPPVTNDGPTCKFWANPTEIQRNQNQSSLLTWESTKGNRWEITPSLNMTISERGNKSVSPTQSITYKFRVTASDGQAIDCYATILVKDGPVITGPACTLNATRITGNRFKLEWTTSSETNGFDLQPYDSPDTLPLNGSVEVTAVTDLTYVGIASKPGFVTGFCYADVSATNDDLPSDLCAARSVTNPIHITRGEEATLAWRIKPGTPSQGSPPQFAKIYGSGNQYQGGALGASGETSTDRSNPMGGTTVPYANEIAIGTFPDRYHLVNGRSFTNDVILKTQQFDFISTRLNVKPQATTTFGLWQQGSDSFPNDANLVISHREYLTNSDNRNLYNSNMAVLRATLDRLNTQKAKQDMSAQDITDLLEAYNTNWFGAAEWTRVNAVNNNTAVEGRTLFLMPDEVVITLTAAEKASIGNPSGLWDGKVTLKQLLSTIYDKRSNSTAAGRQQVFSDHFTELTSKLYSWYDDMAVAKNVDPGLSDYELLVKYRGSVTSNYCPIQVIVDEPANRPYIKVDGSDVYSGASFSENSCNPSEPAKNATIRTNGYFDNRALWGYSGSQYATFASGSIGGIETNTWLGNIGYLRSDKRDLLFANNSDPAGNYYGVSATGMPCVSLDIAKLTQGAQSYDSNSIQNGSGVFQHTGDLIINTTSGIQNKKTIVVDGDVSIGGDITYQSSTSPESIPSLRIIANNIYIKNNVTQIDAELVALPKDQPIPGGLVDTCSTTGSAGTWTKNLTVGSCNRQLTVNGSMIARRVLWKGTRGSVGVADSVVDSSCLHGDTSTISTNKPGVGTGCAAEYINFKPEGYIARFTDSTLQVGTPVSSVELPPIY